MCVSVCVCVCVYIYIYIYIYIYKGSSTIQNGVICVLSHVWDSRDCSHRDPLSMEFSRQEYWIGLSFPSAGDLPKPGIEPAALASCALAGGFFTS